MNKKTHFLPWIVIYLLALVITACQAEQPPAEVCPLDSTIGAYDEDCLSIVTGDELEGAAYPVDEYVIPIVEEALAYPITEADIAQLLKTWRLTTYAEDGVETKPPFRFMTFYDDGGYAIATEPDLFKGTWTTILRAADSTLVLDPGTDAEQYYQIIDLDETELNLRTWRDNIPIDEGYQPDDSGCVCD